MLKSPDTLNMYPCGSVEHPRSVVPPFTDALMTDSIDVKMPFEHDGPGHLSKDGRRHDNDNVEISKINILPTTDEILCKRLPYMPKKDSSPHRHEHGVQRYLDIQFRHLRYESVTSIVDACASALHLATTMSSEPSEWRQETPSGAKYGFFAGVSIEMAMFHEYNGAMFQFSFDCPTIYRGMGKINKAPIFQPGMLCALLCIHEKAHEVEIIFLEVDVCLSTEHMRSRTGSHQKAALQATLADPDDSEKVTKLTSYLRKLKDPTLYLVDMPDVLVRSFLSHLKVLQELSHSEDFAFKNYIAAEDPSADAYSSEGTFLDAPIDIAHDGLFNLNKLKKDKSDPKDLTLPVAPLSPKSHASEYLADIKKRSILDDGQSLALFESLSRDMAFTQGPPGTGKTFLGVAIVETILNSRCPEKDSAPIVVICQTNHALDDFLGELIERGITKITRCGNGSTAKWTEPYLLRSQRSKGQRSGKEAAKLATARILTEDLLRQATIYSEALNEKSFVPWVLVEEHLAKHHKPIADHFAKLDTTSKDNAQTDIRAAKMKLGFSFMYWQEGGDIRDAKGLISAFETMLGESQLTYNWSEAEVAKLKDEVSKSYQASVELVRGDEVEHYLWSLNQAARQNLVSTLLSEMNPSDICEAFAARHRQFCAAKAKRSRLFDESDAAAIRAQNIDVVGMTSTASATMRSLLQDLAPSVILFEEASELIEAHSTIALVPSVKHCIQIGDPLQLRPHVDQRELSSESNPNYRLDESLFQRLIGSNIPYSQLNTQRRAHPNMADLLRAGDYPYLVDHPSTLERPFVSGIPMRMWWFDHNQPEDSIDPLAALSRSASNHYEVKFVASFVNYLVSKQGYKFREITVITPYKGQLAALQKELSRICLITLTEKDHEEMIDENLIEDEEISAGTALSVSLANMLRIATVDNYQGEQARVVIFSAVRSNANNTIGFLASRNRINVAISRAEDGFYIVGNSKVMEKNAHWYKVINCFKAKGAIGNTMMAQCRRHPQRQTRITQPFDFKKAQCKEICGRVLSCGHICSSSCHALEMHIDGRMPCKQICTKKRDCGHNCNHPCGQPCGSCSVESEPVKLLCGHFTNLRCGEILELVDCKKVVDTVELACGHQIPVLCSQNQAPEKQTCNKACNAVLACGHTCSIKCSDCIPAKQHSQTCKSMCGRQLQCGHKCDHSCHPGACSPCKQPCTRSCEHGRCDHLCGEPCKPCVQLREIKGCRHSDVSRSSLCCLPSLVIPCSKPCMKLLSCGIHQCPSLCGEPCSSTCLECEAGVLPSLRQITLPCLHTFPVHELDRRFGMDKVYRYEESKIVPGVGDIIGISVTTIPLPADLACPTCGGPTDSTPRYELPNTLPGLQKTIDSLMRICTQKLSYAFREVSLGEQVLFNKIGDFFTELKFGPMATAINRFKIDERIEQLVNAQQVATESRKLVEQIEQAVQDTCEQLNSHHFPAGISPLSLRMDLLYYWSRLAMVEFGHRVAAKFGASSGSNRQNRVMALGYTASSVEQAAGECMALNAKIELCAMHHLPRLETEFRIVQLCFWSVLQCHDATDRANLDTKASFIRLRHLLRTFPESAGLFVHGVDRLDSAIKFRTLAPRFFELGNANTNILWHKLGNQSEASTLCCNNHVYSTKLFNKCPECGQEVIHMSSEIPGPKEQDDTKPGRVVTTPPPKRMKVVISPKVSEIATPGTEREEAIKPNREVEVPSPKRTKSVMTPNGCETTTPSPAAAVKLGEVTKMPSTNQSEVITSPDRRYQIITGEPEEIMASEQKTMQHQPSPNSLLCTDMSELRGESFEELFRSNKYGSQRSLINA